MATLSPMMQQYMKLKEQNPDTLLFFRVGDFYEMFFDDALTASRELELTLTGKDCGMEERAPMCGVPYHAVDTYVARLVERGYRVAIGEQMQDPALAKGLVERDVIRIVTAGTLTDSAVIGEKRNNFLCSVCVNGRRCGIAACDVSTGEFYVQQVENAPQAIKAALDALSPGEIITNNPETVQPASSLVCRNYNAAAYQNQNAKEALTDHFHVNSLTALGLDASLSVATQAAGALMRYLNETQKNALQHIARVRVLEKNDVMPLDAATRRNLELTETIRGRSAKGSLLSILDQTVTAMGGRLLRSWVEKPLLSKEKIEARLSAVDALYHQHVLSENLREQLMQVYDMERLLSKVSYHTLNARDCLSLLRSLEKAPEILSLLLGVEGDALSFLKELLDPLPELTDLLRRGISPDAPLLLSDGNFIRAGYNEQLDELRTASTEGKQWILDLEAREREETGIKNLRIQYNRVFGYYIEVTKSNYGLVPLRYERRQTLANSERFTTEELRSIERKVTGAQEQAAKLELMLFDEIREEISRNMGRLQSTALAYKTLDALLSLARVALINHYAKPEITEDGAISIVEGRHPVVEVSMPDQSFIPNDTHLDADEHRVQIITGPNMAGKSTYMRQVALITLMAHMGSFVPAQSASISLVDGVYTRVGASDDLATGQSTFMVEMSEMAYILRNATNKSLVILDEIGRGTSTFDGLSIAWAAVEYLADKKKSGAKTLFATHYHELSELEGHLEGVNNFCVSVKEHGEEVIFLRKIVPGGADKSFGIYVAHLAGVPRPVVARAQEIMARLEVNNVNQNTIGQNILGAGHKKKNEQVDLMEYPKTEFIEEIRKLDVMAMTPIDALNQLFLLKEKAMKL
ncbi:MAG: DNA mismatch repair protein MutS [Clostridia bacterium]|nr:DNA mismatch repair protein MutS [Clostridia bacterium]MBR0408264.1 DNA mismatch repair protein MutS [Clostridia bacterium]